MSKKSQPGKQSKLPVPKVDVQKLLTDEVRGPAGKRPMTPKELKRAQNGEVLA